MDSKTALLIVIIGAIHSAWCYTPSKLYSLTDIVNVEHRNPSVRDAVSTEQIFLPSPITVLEIQRNFLGSTVQFTVKYNSTETPVVVEWNYASGTPGTDVGNGVYETTALASPPNDLDGSVLFLYTPDYRESILVYLKFGEDAVETNIPELPLYVEPAGDFVYNEGEDFVFKGRFPHTPGDLGSSYSRYVQSKVTFVDLDTGEAYLEGTDAGHFHRLDLNSYQDYNEMSAKLKTSEWRISGIISMESGVLGPISYIVRIKDVFVHLSTQTGPFPDGYLGFVKDLRPPIEDDIVCTVGERCLASCIAAGEDITEIKVERLLADGGVELLSNPVHLAASFKTPYLRVDRVGFQVDSMPDQPQKIRCTAKNAAGTEISKETTVHLF